MGSALDYLIIAATALLAARIYLSGLRGRYRSLFLFLIFEVLRGCAFAPMAPAGRAYYWTWICTEPMEWLLYILVVLEIYALVLRDYRGLATAGRWCLMFAIVVALFAAGASLLAPSNYTQQSPLVAYYYYAERAVYFSLVVFLLTILGLLMRYPIVLNRNIIAHSLIFCAYFLSITIIYQLLVSNGFRVMPLVRYSMDLLNLGILGAWLLLLNRAGEKRKQQLRPSWMPGEEEELVGQLNRLNLAMQSLIS